MLQHQRTQHKTHLRGTVLRLNAPRRGKFTNNTVDFWIEFRNITLYVHFLEKKKRNNNRTPICLPPGASKPGAIDFYIFCNATSRLRININRYIFFGTRVTFCRNRLRQVLRRLGASKWVFCCCFVFFLQENVRSGGTQFRNLLNMFFFSLFLPKAPDVNPFENRFRATSRKKRLVLGFRTSMWVNVQRSPLLKKLKLETPQRNMGCLVEALKRHV